MRVVPRNTRYFAPDILKISGACYFGGDMSDFIERTISGQVEYLARTMPDQLAVKYHSGFDYERTYAELDAECDTAAKALLALGLKKGDHIAMWATNYPQWIITLFAASSSVTTLLHASMARFP